MRSGEVSKGVTRRNHIVEYLKPKLSHLSGARGCLTLQIFAKADGSSFKAIEINPRFGGGYPLSYAAGANFPRWLLQEYLLEESPDFHDDWQADLLMLRYDAHVLVKGHES